MKVNKEYIENLFKDIVEKNIFIKGSVSNPINKKNGITKGNLKPVKIKNEIFIQLEYFIDKKLIMIIFVYVILLQNFQRY